LRDENQKCFALIGLLTAAAVCVALLLSPVRTSASHSPARAPTSRGVTVHHVLLLSIDGLHALDLANFIRSNPPSNLARLSSFGITYTQASTSKPSDSFPGLMSMVTGGSPISNGVWYEGGYARDLSPAGSHWSTAGTEVVWDSSIDRDKKLFDGGGIDPGKLPRDPQRNCALVYPHDYLRVNTVFEVVHRAKLRTAWADKHPSYEMTNGPSGKGVDDLYTPELSATAANHDLQAAEAFDDRKIAALLNEISGKDHSGTVTVETPSLFGASVQAFSMGQKLGGYLGELGTPSGLLLESLRHTDQSIGRIVDALRRRGLADSTLIIITAKQGESPIDSRKHCIIADTILEGIINKVHPGVLALPYQDGDLASIWLNGQSKTEAVVRTLSNSENESAMDVEEILAGESLKLMFNVPLTDARTPDILLVPRLIGLYPEAGTRFIAEHGGFHQQDVNVALLLARSGTQAKIIKRPVQTTQIAPTILRALGLDPLLLEAVQKEKTQELPDCSSYLNGSP